MIPAALVLAAGKSTRIATAVDGLPKPLVPVGGTPVIARTLAWLAESGVGRVWVNLHYRPELVRAALGTGAAFGLSVSYSHEDPILGTAGAWRRVAAGARETTLVVYGDNLMRFDLGRFLDAHRRGGADATIALFDPRTHANTNIAGGRVRLAPDARVAAFVEGGGEGGPGPSYVNAGAYLLEPAALDAVPDGASDFGRDVFPGLAAGGRLAGYVFEPEGYCLGIDTPESLAVAGELVRSGRVAVA